MIKIFLGFIAFAALAMFILMKGGDIDMSGEKHGIEEHPPAAAAPAAPAAAAPAAAPATAEAPAAPATAPAAEAPAAAPAAAAPAAPAAAPAEVKKN